MAIKNVKKVLKRDGSLEIFNINKIINAVSKAFIEVQGIAIPPKNVLDEITHWSNSIPNKTSVEDIQDGVEKILMSEGQYEVAKAYILYRNERALARAKAADLTDKIKEKLEATNVINQNANVDEYSFGGRIGEASRIVTKEYALNNCMSKMARDRHLNNEIYIHDLDSYAVGMHNCLSIPFDGLLANGFNTRQVDIRPANSINTAFQLIAVIFQIQSLQQFGGVSATHLDWTMVPYVRKSFFKHLNDYIILINNDILSKTKTVSDLNWEDYCKKPEDYSLDIIKHFLKPYAYEYAFILTRKELNQAVEGMYHNLNSLQSRSGNQLPFTSINYGTCTLTEGRMVIQALLEGSIKGVGKFHRTPIFPCGIFQYMKGVNDKPGTPNYDMYCLARKSTAKRLYPNYANVDWSGNAGYDINDPRTYFSTMGCRTANGWDINGFGQLKDGRGNICPVTIILPTIAMEANRDIEMFMELLNKRINEAKDMLIERFEWICSQSPESAKFMYENGTIAGYIPEEGIKSALKHGTLAIGQLGLAETLQILIGKNHTTKEGMELAKKIEQLFKDKCAKFKEEYKLNFGVYYTPAENLCYTAMKKFKDKYGEIPNVSDKDFFTNSIHVPVWEQVTPMEKIDIESQLTGYSSAGCITYVELPSTVDHNDKALEEIINYAMEHDIPYFAINIPVDTCINCGASGEFGDKCPECGSTKIEKLRRVTGYLTGNYLTAFNKGKIQETNLRIKHSK